jgi:transposase
MLFLKLNITCSVFECTFKCVSPMVTKAQRRNYRSWSFNRLKEFVTYKAAIAGVPLVYIDHAYTSQKCPICHDISRSNRPARDEFKCICCGFPGRIGHIAATNIATRVEVNLSIVAQFFTELQAIPLMRG